MIYAKYPALVLLTLSFAQSAHATLRGIPEDSGVFLTTKMNTSKKNTLKVTTPKASNAAEAEYKKNLHNLKCEDMVEVRLEGNGKKGAAENEYAEVSKKNVSDLEKKAQKWFIKSHPLKDILKTNDYIREHKVPILIADELATSANGFIRDARKTEGGLVTALNINDSNDYIILPKIVKSESFQTENPTSTEIDAGQNFTLAKEEAFEAIERATRRKMLTPLGRKLTNEDVAKAAAIAKGQQLLTKQTFGRKLTKEDVAKAAAIAKRQQLLTRQLGQRFIISK